MADIERVRALAAADAGLAVVSMSRGDLTVHSSVVNAGVLAHPLDGDDVVGFVTRGGSWKQRRLRSDPSVTITFRAGWDWVTVEGQADIYGPEEDDDEIDDDDLRHLLRDIFVAAGGEHDDFEEYDRVMRMERRAGVLVRPELVYSNPGS
jgi:hypothetical protein